MPSKPLKPCGHPGCAALIESGTRCAVHMKSSASAIYDANTRRDDPALSQAAKIRSSVNWQKVRALHRQSNPLCADPFGDHNGFPTPAEQSHHILPLATHPDLAYDLDNLAPLCTHCHARVEALERAGKPTSGIFRKL